MRMVTISVKSFFLTKQHTTYQVMQETSLGGCGCGVQSTSACEGPLIFYTGGKFKLQRRLFAYTQFIAVHKPTAISQSSR
jgi:hypothetical protein